MNRIRAPWLLLAAAALLTACNQEQAATAEKAEVGEKAKQAVEMKQEYVKEAEMAAGEIEAGFVAAYNAEDGEGIAVLFADDGMIAPPELVSIEQPSIAAFYNAQFESGGDFTLEVEREGMVVSGKTSVSWGGYATSVVMEGADTIVTTGRYGVVSKLQPDGTWKIHRHLFNYITPPPER
jgi:ketosteroid isomerase-like protein